jgi:hypothetical protein
MVVDACHLAASSNKQHAVPAVMLVERHFQALFPNAREDQL